MSLGNALLRIEQTVAAWGDSDVGTGLGRLFLTFMHFWLWSLPAWLFIGALYEATDSQSGIEVSGLAFFLLVFWLLSIFYTVSLSYIFVTDLFTFPLSKIDAGFAFWRLGLMVPGAMILIFTTRAFWNDGTRLKGWRFAAVTVLVATAARTGAGILTKGGHL